MADADTAEMHQAHLQSLSQRWSEAAAAHGFDGVWIAAGEAALYFGDDQGPPFKPNPYFTQWVPPEFAVPGAHVLLRPGQSPVLFQPQPVDYWHAVPDAPETLAPAVEIRTYPSQQDLLADCRGQSAGKRMAYIGRSLGSNEELGEINPSALLQYTDYHRARKTPWELHLMRRASEIGARGHLAAAKAFTGGGTEFEIHMAYLAASGQLERDLPYANIIALNEHAATLHYTLHDRQHAAPPRSLLIDAGGSAEGYASDITRTYAAAGAEHQAFAELIEAMRGHQDALLASIGPGVRFADLHVQMHHQLTALLVESGIAQCSEQQARDLKLSDAFCPHGLGHLLGVQVHDVGGHQADAQGTPAPPPEHYPSLRFTREVGCDYVFTIEPGLYFIESLLEPLRAAGAPLNWSLVETLVPYGGIRIEDNVRVLDSGIENLTRDAWLRVEHD